MGQLQSSSLQRGPKLPKRPRLNS